MFQNDKLRKRGKERNRRKGNKKMRYGPLLDLWDSEGHQKRKNESGNGEKNHKIRGRYKDIHRPIEFFLIQKNFTKVSFHE